MLGKRSVAERLITEATGLTLVVLDTWKEAAVSVEPFPDQLPTEPPPVGAHVEVRVPRLTALLSPERVLTWDQPMDRDSVLRQLVEKAVKGTDGLRADDVANAVLKRENEGSTFLTEGIALPHARIEGLPGPLLALGRARQGVTGVPVSQPGQLVWLILSPVRDPEIQIRLLAAASQMATNQPLLRDMMSAATPEEVIAALGVWEAGRCR